MATVVTKTVAVCYQSTFNVQQQTFYHKKSIGLNWMHGFIAHIWRYVIYDLDQYLSNLTVLLIVAMIWHPICTITSNIINKQQCGMIIKEKNFVENLFLKLIIVMMYRRYNDDNNNKIMIMRHDTDLKWIQFDLIFIILLCFNVYNGYIGNECPIILHWFEIIFMIIYFSIVILFMQCISVIGVLNHHIMHILMVYFYQSIKYLSYLTIGVNIIALLCHIIAYNRNRNQIINYEFYEKLKK